MATANVSETFGKTIPYDNAHECNGLLFDVLTLIHAALDVDDGRSTKMDREGLTDKRSRMDNLLLQAADKAAAAINKLGV